MKILDEQNSTFYKFMVKYYAFKPMRVFIIFSTFICEITLLIYLMILPIQLAYHSLLSSPQNKKIQDNVDFVVCAFFTFHLFLYFDNTIEKIIKAPNSLPKYRIDRLGKWTRLVTLQLFYNLITWSISVFMASPEQNTFQQRILELFFFFKVYTLYKYHKRTIYVLIGTSMYPTYKVFFTVMVTFTTISYLSSIFYAIDYAILNNGGPLSDLIWLVDTSTQPNLIQKPFWVQLLMINYWAMGTSSTAAYGDICGLAPEEVVFNIFVLYFANFLYGYYLNNIHSIPKQARQQELKVLEQFDQFQKYNNLARQQKKSFKQKIDKELYLKILCSIEYKQSERSALKRIQSAIPSKYIQQIKLQIYSQFFNAQISKKIGAKGLFWKQETLLKISKFIKQFVCETDQNIYLYEHIDGTDLIYLHQGSMQVRLPGELKNLVTIQKNQGQIFGQYCFITNQKRKVEAVARQYVSAFVLKRQDYKKCLTLDEFQYFDLMYNRCLQFNQEQIKNQVLQKYNDKLQQKMSPFDYNKPITRSKKVQKYLKERKQQRFDFQRQKLKQKKVFISNKLNKNKSIGVQTQIIKASYECFQFQTVIGF